MHELDAYSAAVKIASFACVLAVDLQFRLGLRSEKAEWIKVGLKVSPVPEKVENALALKVRGLQERGGRRLRISGSHRYGY
jgi:hypothetical protein